jgi:hypothetical protein
MDKLIEDLNLVTLKQNGERLSKVSLSPERSTSDFADFCVDDEVFCVDGRLNHHLPKGSPAIFRTNLHKFNKRLISWGDDSPSLFSFSRLSCFATMFSLGSHSFSFILCR